MDKIIVADAELRTSLAVIRSLSKYGLKVISIGRSRTGGYLSNCSWKKFCLTDVTDGEYYDFIINIANLEKVKAIFAHFEKTLLQLNERVAWKKSDLKIIMPPLELLKFACKKENVLSVVKELCIPVPKTIYYDGNKDNNLYSIIENEMPCYIKVNEEIDIPPGPGNRYLVIKTKEDLKKVDKFIEKKNKSFFIQECINGYGCGVGGVFYNGAPLVLGGHIRLRESHSSGGVSTYCESKIHKEALNYAKMIMYKLKWSGICMVEFKVNNEGIPYFMEVNPRIWGTIPLYIASGINIPVVAYEVFVNNRFNSFASDFNEGIKMRFLTEDLQAINIQYKGFKKIIEFTKVFFSMHKVKEGTFDMRDPLPFLMPIGYNIIKK